MSVSQPGDPPVRARVVAGFIVLLTSIGMFLLDGLGPWLCGCSIDLKTPAWAFLAIAGYTLFGVSLPALMSGRDASAKERRDRDGV